MQTKYIKITVIDPHSRYLDPLYYGRTLLEHFNLNSTGIAVPTGVSSYDENGKATQGRICVEQYMPNKLVNYAIRLYVFVNSEFNYCFLIFDIGKGNKSGINLCTRYSNVHHELCHPNFF